MKILLRLLLAVGLAGSAGARTLSSLQHARDAQAMLGPATWSRVVRITNRAARSSYPREFGALIFEFSGILWFYTEVDGTQSFSLKANRLAADKAEFAPLLRAIEPGLELREIVAEPPAGDAPSSAGRRHPPNDCFIASVAALQAMLARGESVRAARLLSYYIDTPRGRRGHTLLTYETPRGAFVYDPAGVGQTQKIAADLTKDAMILARWLRGGDAVAQARWVPAPVRAPVQLASLDQPAGTSPRGGTLRLR